MNYEAVRFWKSLTLGVLIVCWRAAHASDAPSHPPKTRTYDLVMRSEILIDRPAQQVWPEFLKMENWMDQSRFRNLSGQRGAEDEVRVLAAGEKPPYRLYLVKAVRVKQYQEYVLRVKPKSGRKDDYSGFAAFRFSDEKGKTHMVYDLYVEKAVKPMTDEEFREFGEAQYQGNWQLVNKNNQNLKAQLESKYAP